MKLAPTANQTARGEVTFTAESGGVHVVGTFSGLVYGEHGFHVHEKGDCSAPDGTSAGGHFNPASKPHAARDAAARHAGDLGNLKADPYGLARVDFVDSTLSLSGADSIVGQGGHHPREGRRLHDAAHGQRRRPAGLRRDRSRQEESVRASLMRTWRLLTATALVWLAMPAARADADLLPSRPITFGDGRVVVSGDVAMPSARRTSAISTCSTIRTTRSTSCRCRLTAEFRATDRVGFVGQVRGRGLAARPRARTQRPPRLLPYALYVRVKPATDQPFTILAGRIPPVFGAFARRDYGEVNPLIGLPLAYGYSTTMRPEPPPSRRELVLNRGGGWAVRYPRATATVGPQGLPLVSARRWDTGVSAQWDGSTIRPASPSRWARCRRRRTTTTTAASRFRPRRHHALGQLQRRRVGRRRRIPVRSPVNSTDYGDVGWLPPPASSETTARRRSAWTPSTPSATSWCAARWWRAGGTCRSRTAIRRCGSDALGSSLETRVALTPRWSMAVRGDRLGFSRVAAADGVVRSWDAPVLRLEGAVGYLVRRNVRLKASYRYQLARRRPRALDRHGRRAAPLLVLMRSTRHRVHPLDSSSRRPGALARHRRRPRPRRRGHGAERPDVVATGTIRGTVGCRRAAGRRPSVTPARRRRRDADGEQEPTDRPAQRRLSREAARRAGSSTSATSRAPSSTSANERFVPHVLAIVRRHDGGLPEQRPHLPQRVLALDPPSRSTSGATRPAGRRRSRFDRPGIVRVFCDIHSHMSAFILVFAHRLFRRHRRRGPLPARQRARRAPTRWSPGTSRRPRIHGG